jgi:glucuronate isomerase
LRRLDHQGKLCKTIIYNLNPSDNEVFATMAGNFQQGPGAGKVQFGASWWFLDQKDGIKDQLDTLSRQGLLSHFIGMLTDSRSLLSYPRHEYFRRILCNVIGTDVENGELPWDEATLGKLIQNICYNNARQYFGFDELLPSTHQ